MTQPIDVERATERYREWLVALKEEASLATINESQAMMHAVMIQLRKALTQEQVLKMANALPALPRGIFIEGWSLDEKPESRTSADALFQGVHAQIQQHHAPPKSSRGMSSRCGIVFCRSALPRLSRHACRWC
jgi:uncharacterized protein (DUF2267 family)